MLSTHVRFEKFLFALRCKSGADDVGRIFFRWSPYNDDDPTINQTDSDEAFLCLRMFFVEDLKIVAGPEEVFRLLE